MKVLLRVQGELSGSNGDQTLDSSRRHQPDQCAGASMNNVVVLQCPVNILLMIRVMMSAQNLRRL